MSNKKELIGPTITDAPDTIWLCVGDLSDSIADTVPFRDLSHTGEVGWCVDPVDDWDIHYVRADRIPVMPEATIVAGSVELKFNSHAEAVAFVIAMREVLK